ncbi:MAG: YihY/virulence factor BrkB family protein [Pseudomonadota bacterium]
MISWPSDKPQERGQAREIQSLSPEARLKRARALVERSQFLKDTPEPEPENRSLRDRLMEIGGPQTYTFQVVRRTIVGTYQDGFIHAGNLAYLAMLAIFPFFILAGALFQLIGELEERRMMIDTVLRAMPPTVEAFIAPVAESVIDARSGWLLWLGVGVALWTVSSLIETIRDILRRAYGTNARQAFWLYRLRSTGIIMGAVVLLLASLFAQVAIGTMMQLLDERLPQVTQAINSLQISRIVPALGLFGSIYLLFLTLTPEKYRDRRYPKWPGAALATLWWIGVTIALPPILSGFFAYDLTYGGLAGMIIALFFFWLVGLGLVIGAEFNAALAEPDMERDSNSKLGAPMPENDGHKEEKDRA